MMTRLEAKRIHRATGIDPLALLRNLGPALAAGRASCPFVHPESRHCTIYEIRPAVCRVFGASEFPILACPHGCRPERRLTQSETSALMDQVDKLGY